MPHSYLNLVSPSCSQQPTNKMNIAMPPIHHSPLSLADNPISTFECFLPLPQQSSPHLSFTKAIGNFIPSPPQINDIQCKPINLVAIRQDQADQPLARMMLMVLFSPSEGVNPLYNGKDVIHSTYVGQKPISSFPMESLCLDQANFGSSTMVS